MRTLPSINWPGFLHPISEALGNDTLDQAQNVGSASTTSRIEIVGTIGNAATGAADVDFYRFQLDRAANVIVATPNAGPTTPSVAAISLYNSDVNNPNDPYDPLGYRLLAQDDSALHTDGPRIERHLAAGTYYVAVSGSGNRYFHPFLAGSGIPGSTGDYGLLITTTDLGLSAADGPIVLASDPAADASLDRSSFVIRVNLSGALDPATIVPGKTVQLKTNSKNTFGDGSDQVVPLAGVSFSSTANELQLKPAAPLKPGYYKVFLEGDATTSKAVLASPSGVPLGRTSVLPNGADASFGFQIAGNEGNSSGQADDTPPNAHELGDLTSAGLVQRVGAIGVDATDPIAFNPATVNLYHFRLSGAGRFAFVAEVFAGRIGSPLVPAATLFQVGTTDHQLHLVTANADTFNASKATNGLVPLYTDSALFAGLMEGDYYMAVSSAPNVPLGTTAPGTNGVFDPKVSHSGQNGSSTGGYVLNVRAQSNNVAPQVVSTTLPEAAVLDSPPVSFAVKFTEPVNLLQLTYANYQHNFINTIDQVYIQGSDGTKYYPQVESFDPTTNQGNFLMLDGLGKGSYQLHLSGRLGLTDFAGNPLVANDPSGDYVVHFSVSSDRGLAWTDQEPNGDLSHPQVIGVLFPRELATKAGVTITRDFTQNPASDPADQSDNYQIQVLQYQYYGFFLNGTGLPAGVKVTIFDSTGSQVLTAPVANTGGASAFLAPGTYVVHVGDWTKTKAGTVTYQLAIKQVRLFDNPLPVTLGPVPAISIRLVSAPPLSSPSQGATDRSPVASSPPAVTINTPATAVSPPPATPDPKTAVVPPSGTPAPAPVTGTPPRPALPVALVVALVAPSGVSTVGTPPTLTASALYRPPEVSTAAPSILLVLGVGPVGGVQDPAAIDNSQQTERPVVRVIDGLVRPEAPQHPLPSQTVHSGTAAGEGSKSSQVEESSRSSENSPSQTPDTNSEVNGLDISRLPEALQQFSSSCLQAWEQVTDTLFSTPNGLNQRRGVAQRITLQPHVGGGVLASALATVTAFAVLSPNKWHMGRTVVGLRRSKPKLGAPKGPGPLETSPWKGLDPSWG